MATFWAKGLILPNYNKLSKAQVNDYWQQKGHTNTMFLVDYIILTCIHH